MMWINGDLVADGQISALDHGFTVGDGVFETIKTVNGQPFALSRHLQRLAASASGMLLPAPSEDEVRRAVRQLLEVEKFSLGRLRITWSAGTGGAGSKRAQDLRPTLVITHHEAKAWPSSAKVAIMHWPRSERSPLMHLKTISYAENVLALAQAETAGADEAVFFNYQGHLSEGTGSNVIVRVGNEWITPCLDCGVLAGVTRALAIQWCGVKEGCITREELDSSDEVVLSSSTRDLQPVSMIDGRSLSGWQSDATQALLAQFAREAERTLDP